MEHNLCTIGFSLMVLRRARYTIDVSLDPLKALEKEVAILHNYYKPEMKKIYNMIYPELPVDEFCQNESRFQWLKTYLC